MKLYLKVIAVLIAASLFNASCTESIGITHFENAEVEQNHNLQKEIMISGSLISINESKIKLENVSDESFVQWTFSPASMVERANGMSATALLSANKRLKNGGFGTIIFKVKNTDGEINTYTKNIWVGKPELNKVEENYGTCYTPWLQFKTNNIDGVKYNWSIDSDRLKIIEIGNTCLVEDLNMKEGKTERFILKLTKTSNGVKVTETISSAYYKPFFCDCNQDSPVCTGSSGEVIL